MLSTYIIPYSKYYSTSQTSATSPLHTNITFIQSHFLLVHSPKILCTSIHFIIKNLASLSHHSSITNIFLSLSRITLNAQTLSFAFHYGKHTHVLTHIVTFSLPKVQCKNPLQESLMFRDLGLLS